MSKIPQSLKSTWRTVQVFKTIEGLNSGLGMFIATVYFYVIFQNESTSTDALFYTTLCIAINFGLIALLEIPTGAIADTFGRVRSIIISLSICVIHYVLLISLFFIHNLAILLLLAIITRFTGALAYTLQSGSFSAWLVDSMREREPGYGFERLLARGSALCNFAMVFGGLLGITCYLYGAPYIPYIGMTMLTLGCLSFCLISMEESKNLIFYKIDGGLLQLMGQHTIKTIKIAFSLCRQTKIIQWLIIVYVGYSFINIVVNRLWPVALGGQFGVSKWSWQWYSMALIIPLMSGWAAKLLALRGDKTKDQNKDASAKGLMFWLLTCVYLSALSILILGFVNHVGIINFPIFAIAILVVEVSVDVVRPAFDTLVCQYMPEKHAQERATVLSIASALRSVLVLIFIIPSRGATAALSPVGWMLPAGIVLGIGLVSHYFISKYQKRSTSLHNEKILEVCHETVGNE